MSAKSAARVSFKAPLAGVMVLIEDVPDPVSVRKMVGDGFPVDPLEGRLTSSALGEVVDLQLSYHAITVRSVEGLEILMHIGLDTVRLGGDDLRAHVSEGQRAGVGDPLIDFDPDDVGRKAKSLLTQVVVTNTELFPAIILIVGLVSDGIGEAAVVELKPLEEPTQELGTAVDAALDALVVPNPTGLHARPTATLVALTKQYRSDIQLRRGDDSTNAKFTVAITSLAAARGKKVVVTAHGTDAKEAVAVISQGTRESLGEDCPTLSSGGIVGTEDTIPIPIITEPVAETAGLWLGDWSLLLGASASPGLGTGRVVQLHHEDTVAEEFVEDRYKERYKLNSAIDQALLDLSTLQGRMSEGAPEERAAVFAVRQEIPGGPELSDLATPAIDKGKLAALVWRGAFNAFANQLARLKNETLAGRASGVRDVGQRMLEELTSQRSEKGELPENTILVAEELTLSDTAQLDCSRVVGFTTIGGGASSHVVIIARSLDTPAVAGIEARALDIADGTLMVLDGSKGTLCTGITDEEIARLREGQARMAEHKTVEEAAKDEPAVTTDGHRVTVVANIGGVDDAIASMDKGAEGVGLLHSELIFMGRSTAPTGTEQTQTYTDYAKAPKPGQPLAIRAPDVGGDKPLVYLPTPVEENPFLGVRGIRVGLEQPEVLRTQIHAVLASSDVGAKLHVMSPMIATTDDWCRMKQIFDEEHSKVAVWDRVNVGIMMEAPSVAVMTRQLVAEDGYDFFSVGTNDLTSYTLAMDRGHPKLTSQVDSCNPAVLVPIGQAAEVLHERGRWLGMCGGVASDPQAMSILVGLGVDELNCSTPAILLVKTAMRAYDLSTCRTLAEKAANCATPAEVWTPVPVDEA